jgi:hypothetical protein
MKEFLSFLDNSAVGNWVRDAPTIWAFPTILVLHTIGMAIVAGGSTMISLVMLGFWPAVPIKPFARVFPYMWAAFFLNAVTGTLMLIADATNKLTSLDFYIKMALVFLGMYLLFRIQRQIFQNPQVDLAPLPGNSKLLAWASIACWFGAITSGRLLAYVGPGTAGNH